MTDEDIENVRIVMPEHITTKETDRRGRLSLGKEYGNQEVTVAVVKVEDNE